MLKYFAFGLSFSLFKTEKMTDCTMFDVPIFNTMLTGTTLYFGSVAVVVYTLVQSSAPWHALLKQHDFRISNDLTLDDLFYVIQKSWKVLSLKHRLHNVLSASVTIGALRLT